MAFTKRTWTDGTLVSATDLNDLETRIDSGAGSSAPTIRTSGRTGRALRYTNAPGSQNWSGITYSTYDLIILHYISDTSRLDLIKAASPSTLVLAYVDLIYAGTPGTDATLLNVATARSNGWLATTNGTTEIENPFYAAGTSNQRLLDMGKPGVKEALADAMVAALATSSKWDGLFLDDVNPAYAEGWTVVPVINGYTTTTQWGMAIKAALAYCKTRVTSKLLIGNIGQWVDVPTIGDDIAGVIDGAELELFAQDFSRSTQTTTKISNQAASAKKLTDAKKIFLGVAQNTNATTDSQTVRYGLAAMHAMNEFPYWIMASHTQGNYGSPEPATSPELGRDNGAPISAMTNTSGLLYRQYRNWDIYANTTAATIALPSGKAATGVASTDIFTATNHGFVAGDQVKFSAMTGGTGITAGTTYFVIAANLTANTFQVSTTSGGAALNFTADMTAGTVTLQLPAMSGKFMPR